MGWAWAACCDSDIGPGLVWLVASRPVVKQLVMAAVGGWLGTRLGVDWWVGEAGERGRNE